MIDESGNFSGVAAKELEEETGITIQEGELVSLGSFYTSPGGCDEEIVMYFIEKIMSEQEIQKLLGGQYGTKSEEIRIVLEEIDESSVFEYKDCKLISCFFAYQNYKKQKEIS